MHNTITIKSSSNDFLLFANINIFSMYLYYWDYIFMLQL